MPSLIRHALFQKASQCNDLRLFRQDFALATGLELTFIADGSEDMLPSPGEPEAFVAAVPVHISGIVVGHLRFAARCPPSGPDNVGEGLALSHARVQAYRRILEMAAQQVALRLTTQLANPTAELPRIVELACRAIRRRALTDHLRLPQIARECGVSASHLSRVFHHAAGLTFHEYVVRRRVEHARHLVLTTDRPITHIAFQSGFGSLSQFNRAFRAAFGKAPRQLRAERDRVRLLVPAGKAT